jgi:class 3 adenylate cyclase
MHIEELFNRRNIVDLSFFNFRNAVTAAYFADRELNILKVNSNFESFFPVLGNVTNANFLHVLEQLGVESAQIESFSKKLNENGHVLIPNIKLKIEGRDKVYSLLSAYTSDDSFSYLNGIQGQFVDRTEEFELRKERESLLEEKIRNREIIEEKSQQLERLAKRLAQYLSPQIYDSIFADKVSDKRKIERKNLTVFFSDIVGFTDITDGIEPERLAFMINTYLSEMSKIALQYGGTIDKFIGDAIMIFFGDPETNGEKDDAVRCVKMAISMQNRAHELKELWRSRGISQPLEVRMGIDTGYCTVGDFGSEQRLDYTVFGSPVNLASRLEHDAEPNKIKISESTYLLVQDHVECTKLEDIMPKGFVRPVGVYQVNRLQDAVELEMNEKLISEVGKHVRVDIYNRERIHESIAELKNILTQFEKRDKL